MAEIIQTLDSTLLDLPPSCIKFWPGHSAWLVVGTYELDKNVDLAARVPTDERANKDPSDLREGPVSTASLNFHNYSRSAQTLSYDDKESCGDEDNKSSLETTGEQTLSSTLQERKGSLMLYNIESGTLRLRQSRLYPYGAIYDLQFSPADPDYFVVSSSTGRISLFHIVNAEEGPNLVHISTWKIFDDSVLITYLAWCPLQAEEASQTIALTASTGVVQLIAITGNMLDACNNELSLKKLKPPLALHALKVPHVGEEPQYAYCCFWALPPGGMNEDFHGVFSGGDDSKLRACIMGPSTEREDEIFDFNLPTTFSGHDAAVIAILPVPCSDKQWVLLTGSYDNKVRVITMQWDGALQDREASISAILDVGGGAYRLEFLRDYANQENTNGDLCYQVLASCMEVGAKILQVERRNNLWSIEVIASIDIDFPQWTSSSSKSQLCYASAVQRTKEAGDVIFVSSCFTKRQLGVYKFLSA